MIYLSAIVLLDWSFPRLLTTDNKKRKEKENKPTTTTRLQTSTGNRTNRRSDQFENESTFISGIEVGLVSGHGQLKKMSFGPIKLIVIYFLWKNI